MEKECKQRDSDIIRVVLYGPESTGKTTLSKQLASYYHTNWVPEYMRTFLENKAFIPGEEIVSIYCQLRETPNLLGYIDLYQPKLGVA